MPILRESDRQEISRRLAGLRDPVRLIFFGQTINCPYCPQTQQLVQEVGSLSDKIQVEALNALLDKEKVQPFGVDKVPAIAVIASSPLTEPPVETSSGEGDPAARELGDPVDYGIRFYGIPAGFEFASFLESIQLVSQGNTRLAAESREALAKINRPVHLQVFTTPTCPYCPRAVGLALRFAVENPWVRTDAIEATEFPELAARYQVYAVPRVVINDTYFVEGALPEAAMIRHLLSALGLEDAVGDEGAAPTSRVDMPSR